jgi:gamma-glutamyl phosphate reductase
MLSSIFCIGLIYVMDDHSWMYQVSPEGLRRMDYCNGVEVLLVTHYLIREILMEMILDFHVRDVKIKSFSIQML